MSSHCSSPDLSAAFEARKIPRLKEGTSTSVLPSQQNSMRKPTKFVGRLAPHNVLPAIGTEMAAVDQNPRASALARALSTLLGRRNQHNAKQKRQDFLQWKDKGLRTKGREFESTEYRT